MLLAERFRVLHHGFHRLFGMLKARNDSLLNIRYNLLFKLYEGCFDMSVIIKKSLKHILLIIVENERNIIK